MTCTRDQLHFLDGRHDLFEICSRQRRPGQDIVLALKDEDRDPECVHMPVERPTRSLGSWRQVAAAQKRVGDYSLMWNVSLCRDRAEVRGEIHPDVKRPTSPSGGVRSFPPHWRRME